jgi:hypothetical protein
LTVMPRRGRYSTSSAQKYSSSTNTTLTVMCCLAACRVLPPKYAALGHQCLMPTHVRSATKQHRHVKA